MIVGPSLVGSALVASALVSPALTNTGVELFESSFTMIAPVVYPETYNWAPVAGRLQNYQGYYVILETLRYAYATIDGNGADPGLSVSELSGMTGTAIDLTSGDTAAQAATDWAAGVAALPNWGLTVSDGADVDYSGPGVVAAAAADWDDRGNDPITTDERNGMLGMDTFVYDAGAAMVDGALAGICTSQHMTVPSGGDRRVYALQIYVGAGWDSSSSERAHWALYSGTSSSTPVTGSAILYDFGQELTTFSADGWHTLWVDADTLVEVSATDEIWLSAYSDGVTTTHALSNNAGAGHIGDWTDAALVESTSVMPTDATTAAPSAHSGTTTAGYGGTFLARLICEIAPFAGRAELGSAVDPLIIGHHNDFTDAELDANAVLTQSVTMPAVGPVIPVGVDMSVGTSHDGTNQPRGFVHQGASFAAPAQPDIEGATLVRDFGQMTGTTTSDWVRMTGGVEVEVANQAVLTWGITHAGSDGGTVTNIAYISGETSVLLNCDTINEPMDWIPVDAGLPVLGPEVALTLDALSNFDVNDPTVAPPATIGSYIVPTNALHFDNIGGIRGLYRSAGVVAV